MGDLTMTCPVPDHDSDCWACDGSGSVTFTGEAAEQAGATLVSIDRWADRREQERR